jgi:hypothetical protein
LYGPSDRRSTPRIRRYRFRGNFAKETRCFSSLEPAVQNVNPEYVFFFLKRSLISTNSKIRFPLFTSLPLILFWP